MVKTAPPPLVLSPTPKKLLLWPVWTVPVADRTAADILLLRANGAQGIWCASHHPSGIRGIRFPSKTHGHAPVCRPRIETISKAHGFPPRTVARNSLKPAKKDREQEILLFPVLHPSPVPQPLPHEQRRGPSASEKPSMSPALSSSPIKVFGKDGGSLRGEPFSKKVSLPPSSPNFPPTRSSRSAWSSPRRAGRARARPERHGNP